MIYKIISIAFALNFFIDAFQNKKIKNKNSLRKIFMYRKGNIISYRKYLLLYYHLIKMIFKRICAIALK
jgi:hypothetical protein